MQLSATILFMRRSKNAYLMNKDTTLNFKYKLNSRDTIENLKIIYDGDNYVLYIYEPKIR